MSRIKTPMFLLSFIFIVDLFSRGASAQMTISICMLVKTVIIILAIDEMEFLVHAEFNCTKVIPVCIEAGEPFFTIFCRLQRFITYRKVRFVPHVCTNA